MSRVVPFWALLVTLFGCSWGPSWVSRRPFWALLEASWETWELLGRPGCVLGASRGGFGALLGPLGEPLGGLLGVSWGRFGSSWAVLARLEGHLRSNFGLQCRRWPNLSARWLKRGRKRRSGRVIFEGPSIVFCIFCFSALMALWEALEGCLGGSWGVLGAPWGGLGAL